MKIKMNLKKIIAVLMIVILAASIWLNYRYNSKKETDTSKNLGEAVFVSNDVNAEEEDVFLNQKTDREREREKSVELLSDVVNNPQSGEDAIHNAQEEKIRIAKAIADEADCEALIKSKGFKNVFVSIEREEAVVCVAEETLIPAQLAQIQEIVSSVTKISPEKIKIVLSH